MKIEILREECTDHLHDLWVFLFARALIHITRFRAFFPARLALKSDFGEGLSPAMAFDLSFEPVLSKSQGQKRVPVHFCFALSFFLSFFFL